MVGESNVGRRARTSYLGKCCIPLRVAWKLGDQGGRYSEEKQSFGPRAGKEKLEGTTDVEQRRLEQ